MRSGRRSGGRRPKPPICVTGSEAFDWLAGTLAGEIAAGRRVLAGFDFPFGYPAGFAAAVTGSADPLRLWDWFAAELEDAPKANNRFALAARINAMLPGVGPFWFNGGLEEFAHLPRKGTARDTLHGLPERRLADRRAKGAFTCWQMGGAGAVGSQVMTGMAVLARLRARFGDAVAVWPFEAREAPVVLAEVWPSLLKDEVRAAGRRGRDPRPGCRSGCWRRRWPRCRRPARSRRR